jgi:hypothetical protein
MARLARVVAAGVPHVTRHCNRRQRNEANGRSEGIIMYCVPLIGRMIQSPADCQNLRSSLSGSFSTRHWLFSSITGRVFVS